LPSSEPPEAEERYAARAEEAFADDSDRREP